MVLILKLAINLFIFSITSLASLIVNLLIYMQPSKMPNLSLLAIHCCLSRSLMAFCYITSIALLLITCYERYQAIIYPEKSNLSLHARRLIFFLAWLISTIIASPLLFIITAHESYPYYCKLRPQFELFYHYYYPFVAITCYFIPDVILMCCYIRLIIRLKSVVQVVGSLSIPPAGQYEKRKRQVIKMLTVATLAYVILTLLWAIALCFIGYHGGAVRSLFSSFSAFAFFFSMAKLLYAMTPLANVIIWFHCNDELYHQLYRMLRLMMKSCTFHRKNRVVPVRSSLIHRSSNNNEIFTPLHEL